MNYLVAHQNRLILADPKLGVVLDRIDLSLSFDSECEIERYTVLPGYELVRLSQVPDSAKVLDLRAELERSDPFQYQLLSRAQQLLNWRINHQFCGRCGGPTAFGLTEMVLKCSDCGHHAYPRLSPCIITLVEDGDRILLAHNAKFTPNRFSTLAGFIDAGETAEQAVAREVKEEVGVEISNVRYFKSQQWPFPDSLMLAFFAQYAGGDIKPDGHEILEGRWFTKDELQTVVLPPKFAISRALIDDWVARQNEPIS